MAAGVADLANACTSSAWPDRASRVEAGYREAAGGEDPRLTREGPIRACESTLDAVSRPNHHPANISDLEGPHLFTSGTPHCLGRYQRELIGDSGYGHLVDELPGSRGRLLPPRRLAIQIEGRDYMIVLGLILLIIGLIAKVAILWTIGIVLVLVGLVLMVLGLMGRAVGGRGHYY
jgi:hypothetical protein